MQCSSAVLTMNWQEQKRFFFASNVLKFANSKWEHNGWTLQIWSKNMRPYFILNTAFPQIILAAIFLFWRCRKFHIVCVKYRGPKIRVTWWVKRSICVENIWIFARFLKLLRSCWEKSRKNVEILRKIKKNLKLTALASQQSSLVLSQ